MAALLAPTSSALPSRPLVALDPALASATGPVTVDYLDTQAAAVAMAPSSGAALRGLSEVAQWAAMARMLELSGSSQRVGELLWDPDFVGNVGALALEARSPLVREAATGLLACAFARTASGGLAHDIATRALVLGHGAAAPRELARCGVDPELAIQALSHARWGLNEPSCRSARDERRMQQLGMTAQGVKVRVVDLKGSDHFVHTLALVRPFGSACSLNDYGLEDDWGQVMLEGIHDALKLTTAEGERVLSISVGASARDDGYPGYDAKLAEVRALIDAFPGLLVVAAGNSGAAGVPNDLAQSPRVLVAGALDVAERQLMPHSTRPQHHPERVLGIGATVIAPGLDGNDRLLRDQTSWCAPQVGDLLARSLQLAFDAGVHLDALGVSDVLLQSAEPLDDGSRRADGVAAGAWIRCLALLEQLGTAADLRAWEGLGSMERRQAALAVVPYLGPLGASPGQLPLQTLREAMEG